MSEYKFKINGKDFNVAINEIEGKNAKVTVNGTSYDVELENGAPSAPTAAPVAAPAVTAQPVQASSKPSAPAGGKTVTSPLPGVIVEVSVKEGQSVKRGQKVAVLEAMKMENEIQASCDGTVTKVFVNKGDSILEGADLVTIG